MAKKAEQQPQRSNHIRFIMLEADLSEGNLSELTQAITSALRPASPPALRRISGVQPPTVLTAASSNGDETADPSEAATVEDDATLTDQITVDAAQPKPPRKPAKRAQPQYLKDLDTSGSHGVPLKDFAQNRAATSHQKRYLIAAAWFKENGVEHIGINEMYTAYKTIGWPTNIADWDLAFRNLVHDEWIHRAEKGKYTITPVGESKVPPQTH